MRKHFWRRLAGLESSPPVPKRRKPKNKKEISGSKNKLWLSAIAVIVLFLTVSLWYGVFSQTDTIKINIPERYDQPLTLFRGDQVLALIPVASAQVQVETNDRQHIYHEAYPQTDVIQTNLKHKLKEELILKQPGHPTQFQYLIQDIDKFYITKDQAGNIVFYDQKTYQKQGPDRDLSRVFTLPRPFIKDSQGNKSYEAIETIITGNTLTITINQDWLKTAQYPLTLDPTIEINILNIHSHPAQGDNWEVLFTTVGKADLKIIPNDQATIDDDEFVSLWCGNKEKEPEILEGDIIYYKNWSCDGVGMVVHYTRKAGNHTLKIEFGPPSPDGFGEASPQTAYAYNSTLNLTQRAGILENDEDSSNLTSPHTAEIGERLRVKIQIDTDSSATSTKVLKLQYDNNDSNWTDVVPNAEIRPALSPIIKGKMTLGGPDVATCQSGKTWRKGIAFEGQGRTDPFPIYTLTCQEIAFVIDTLNAQTNTTYRFRLATTTDNITSITYNSYPSLTTVSPQNKTYSKSFSATTSLTNTNLRYVLDNQAYNNLSSSNNSYETLSNPILDPIEDFAFDTPDPGVSSQIGRSVASGDFNGDGYDDLLIGNDSYDLGKVFIVFGKAGHPATTTSLADITLTNPSGASNTDSFGISVASGDFNGDGYDDALIGAYDYPNGVMYGRAYIFYGSANMSDTSTANVTFDNPGGTQEDYLGYSVASGDFNADGYDDALVGAYRYPNDFHGRAYIFYGSANMSDTSTADVAFDNPGGAQDDFFGTSVASGDFNGDGYDDALVGAFLYPNIGFDGRAYIFYGSASMSSTSTANVTFDNPPGAQDDLFGTSVASGDFNGDGYNDALVGASGYPNGGGSGGDGRAYIFYGSTNMSDTSTADVAFDNPGGAQDDYFGYSVASGDFNGDGYDDALVGAYNYPNEGGDGRAYIFYGSTNMSDTSTADVTFDNPGGAQDDYFGYSVASGDFNGDGYNDALVGAYIYPNSGADGRAYIFYGGRIATSADSIADREYEFPGTIDDGYFGYSIATGDFNGDGQLDMLVGTGSSTLGKVYIFLGATTSPGINPPSTSTADIILEYPEADSGASFGISVSSGDFNGDGYTDALIGAYDSNNPGEDEGAAYIYYGSSTLASPNNTADVELNYPEADTDAWFGIAVSSGDFNGDGYADALVGAYSSNNPGNGEGAAYIYYGAASAMSSGENADVELNYPESDIFSYFGISVSSGDFNGDGYADALVGAGYSNNPGTDEGAAYIYYGAASSMSSGENADVELNYPESDTFSYFGISVSSGDFNGDGYADALVGAYVSNNPGSGEGAAYIYYGAASAMSSGENADVELNYPESDTNAYFGYSVSSGDFSGDGYADALVGAYESNNPGSGEGAAYIYYGAASSMSSGENADVELNYPESDTSAYFGYSVSSGDFNNDGYNEAIVGAYQADVDASDNEGKVYIFNGAKSASYPIFLFADKNDVNTDNIEISWEGRTSTATPVYLDIYNLNTNSWETLDSSTPTAYTDFSLDYSVTTNLPYYYNPNRQVFIRVYQNAGNNIFQTDYFNLGFEHKKTILNTPITNYYTSGLVGHWTFNGQDMDWSSSTAEALDRSGNDNHGDVMNGAKPDGGRIGQAMRFDGSDDYVNYGDAIFSSGGPVTTEDFTISLWINMTSAAFEYPIDKWESDNDRMYLRLSTANIRFVVFAGGVNYMDIGHSAWGMDSGQWTHLVVVCPRGGTGAMYKNGISQTVGWNTCDTGDISNTGDLLIGYSQYASDYFPGTIDEVRIYNRALSADEVQKLYRAGARKLQLASPITDYYTNGLVGSWTFNGQDMDWGSTTAEALDRSGNNNHGDVKNGAKADGGKVGQGMRFDGVDDQVIKSDTATLSGLSAVTVSAWIKPNQWKPHNTCDADNCEENIVAKSNWSSQREYRIKHISATPNRIVWNLSADGAANTEATIPIASVPVGQWTYLVGTWDTETSDILFYLNGVQTASNTLSASNIFDGSANLAIGSSGDNGGGAQDDFDGLIDEVRIYNRALSATEIQKLYEVSSRKVIFSQ